MNDPGISLTAFLDACPTAFHAASFTADILRQNGFVELFEENAWQLTPGKYFVRRNSSALVAFCWSGRPVTGFQMASAHGDSPAFRVKDAISEGQTVRIAVERYGGMRPEGWLDRLLTVAGRVMVRSAMGAEERLIHVDAPFLLIPSVAPHLAKEQTYQIGHDLLAFMQNGTDKTVFWQKIATAAHCKMEDILSHELYLIPAEKAALWGDGEAFITSPRLDDLACVWGLLNGFLQAKENTSAVPVFALLDNEEIGSATRQGADSDLLLRVLERIATMQKEHTLSELLATSFFISADNAHARHPNRADLSDPHTSLCLLNGGPVIKHSAQRRYTTDSISEAIFRLLCEKANVKLQDYYNRADIPGGSTLGYIAGTHVSVLSVDIGLPQWAMHAAVETAGMGDAMALCQLCALYFAGCIRHTGNYWYFSIDGNEERGQV